MSENQREGPGFTEDESAGQATARQPAAAPSTEGTSAETANAQPHSAEPHNAEPKHSGFSLTRTLLSLSWEFVGDIFGRNPNRVRPAGHGEVEPIERAQSIPPASVQVSGRTPRTADWIKPGGVQSPQAQSFGALLIVCSFPVAFAAGVGFVVAYWMGANNLVLGGTLALTLGGFGLALVLWAHWLMPDKQAIEPRERMPSSRAERTAINDSFSDGVQDVSRRGLLGWMTAAFTGLLAAMVLSLMRSLGKNPDNSLYSTVWKSGQRLVTAGGKVLTVDSLTPGSYITVYPEDKLGDERSQTMLIRVKEQLLQLPASRASWAPAGYVAYSRVCTHAGCAVGLFETTSNLLLCPCHQSTFDVLRAARPVGGPAARPLPQLPLYADKEGTLRAGGGFTAPPGPGFWGMP